MSHLLERQRPSARASLIRSALLFTPLFLLVLAGLGFVVRSLVEDFGAGGIIGAVIVGLVALLTGYQCVQSLRDLSASPVETRGPIHRKWSRADLFVLRSYYLMVERNVFRVEPEEFDELNVGDTVSIIHYPHTATVESVSLVERGSAGGRPRR